MTLWHITEDMLEKIIESRALISRANNYLDVGDSEGAAFLYEFARKSLACAEREIFRDRAAISYSLPKKIRGELDALADKIYDAMLDNRKKANISEATA